MKKIFLTMLGAILIALPASAQAPVGVTVAKVDVEKIKSNIAKSDSDIADAKKGAKAATWLKRGDAFMEAEAKPVNGVYVGMPENVLTLSFGQDVQATDETVGETTYKAYPFEHFKAYVSNGVVEFFVPTTVIDPSALDKAYEAYDKAYGLDSKTTVDVMNGMSSIHLKSFENGGALYSLGKYTEAATNFRRAFTASAHPASPSVDTIAIYYAGMSSSFGNDNANALVDLDKAIEMDYEADGDVYRLKFITLYSLDRREEALATIQEGIAKYPANEDLIDMALRYYAENDGDPSSLIPLVQDAIDKNPNNPNLYQGLAGVYEKLGRLDDAIEAIKKAVALAPDNFLANHFEGLFLLEKGDKMNDDLGKLTITSSAQMQEARSAVTDVFRSALAPLEKAHAIDPTEPVTVELLKNLTFRLREEPGMQDKNTKYSELLNTLIAQ